MGGCVGFGMAKHFPNRLLSLVLGGATPFIHHYTTKPNPGELLSQRGVDEGAEAIVKEFKQLQVLSIVQDQQGQG